MTYFVYILRCSDQSLYTGITTDVERRLKEHNTTRKGAKYTRTKRPCTLVYQQEYPNRSDASKAEYQLKQLPRERKMSLIKESSRV